MASSGPQLLKDYLASDSHSCSSSGFRSFPRRLQRSSIRTLFQNDLNANNPNSSPAKLTRSRSKAVRFFANAGAKLFPFITVNKSRREEFRRSEAAVAAGPVKVKDILRWKSFRDLVDEEEDSPPPLDFDDGTTTTSTESGSSRNTSASSWCDSDFTAEELPCWGGNSCGYLEGKRFLPAVGVGGDSDSTVEQKGDLTCEEKGQNSPVSVLNFPIQEDEQSFSPFQLCLQNLERRKKMLLQDLEQFEHLSTKLGTTNLEDNFYMDCEEYHGDHENKYVQKGDGNEEKARQLLNHIRTTSSVETHEASVDQLLLDFFCNELATSSKQNYARFDSDILRVAEDWVSGKYEESFAWEMEGKREAYVRDMERGERWKKFEEEREELAMEMESCVFDCLVDELVIDLSCSLRISKD